MIAKMIWTRLIRTDAAEIVKRKPILCIQYPPVKPAFACLSVTPEYGGIRKRDLHKTQKQPAATASSQDREFARARSVRFNHASRRSHDWLRHFIVLAAMAEIGGPAW